jgi:butyryl-CoA dehydrogenase
LALELYCAKLVDELHTGEAAAEASLLLEMLTPIAKSWPSEWCLEANSLAIQVHGGYGYTRDFPVEQYWRDNRLNMIHEGTHGIQALDLLGRGGRRRRRRGAEAAGARVNATLDRAVRHGPAEHAKRAGGGLLGWRRRSFGASGAPRGGGGLRRAHIDAFGHLVIGVPRSARWRRRARRQPPDLARGKFVAAGFFRHHRRHDAGGCRRRDDSRSRLLDGWSRQPNRRTRDEACRNFRPHGKSPRMEGHVGCRSSWVGAARASCSAARRSIWKRRRAPAGRDAHWLAADASDPARS